MRLLTALIFVLLIGLAATEQASGQAGGTARLFATSAAQGIVEIDPDDGTVLNTFAAPETLGVNDGLAFDGLNLWYLSGSWDPETLYKLDPNTGAVRDSFTLPDDTRDGLAAIGDLIYVANSSAIDQDILEVSSASGAVLRTIDVDTANPGLLFSGGLGALRDPDALLVPDALTSDIYLLSLTDGSSTDDFDGGLAGDLGLASIGDEIFVAKNTGLTDQITVFNRQGVQQRMLTVSGSIGLQSLAGNVDLTPSPGTTTLFRSGAWFEYDVETGDVANAVWTGSPDPGCIPLKADPDGDGDKSLTLFCGGAWHFYDDSGSYIKSIWTGGVAGDVPVPADYDGDEADEIVVFRGGAWLFFDFATGAPEPAKNRWTGAPPHWLGGTPVPAPMDYDGDGRGRVYGLLRRAVALFQRRRQLQQRASGPAASRATSPCRRITTATAMRTSWCSAAGAWLFHDFATRRAGAGQAPLDGSAAALAGRPRRCRPRSTSDGDGEYEFTVYSGGPWHLFNDDGTYNKGIWTGGLAGDVDVSRRPVIP